MLAATAALEAKNTNDNANVSNDVAGAVGDEGNEDNENEIYGEPEANTAGSVGSDTWHQVCVLYCRDCLNWEYPGCRMHSCLLSTKKGIVFNLFI